MKYYKYDDEKGITDLEDDEGCPYRQITIGDGKFNASNINYPRWGPFKGAAGTSRARQVIFKPDFCHSPSKRI